MIMGFDGQEKTRMIRDKLRKVTSSKAGGEGRG